jgi:hypothetical protein
MESSALLITLLLINVVFYLDTVTVLALLVMTKDKKNKKR